MPRPPAAKISLQRIIAYHLVESKEQAEAMREEWLKNGVPVEQNIVLVVDTPEKEAETLKALDEAFSAAWVAELGVDGHIVDLRGLNE
jgi:hypothetical protein